MKLKISTIFLVAAFISVGFYSISDNEPNDVANQFEQSTNEIKLYNSTLDPNFYGQTDNPAILHDQSELVSNPGAGFGGADASAITAPGTLFGASTTGNPFKMSDDFTIPSGQSWQIDSIIVFGYQTGSTTTSTITEARLEIQSGIGPDTTGSTVVFGDTTTNRMLGTYWSGIYRVTSTTLTNSQRPIMRVNVTVNSTLPSGDYWLISSLKGSLASGPWSPPRTIPAVPLTGNGKQRVATGWQPYVDGTPPSGQGVPFIIYGSVVGGGPMWPVPELLYYQMNDVNAGATPNHADPGAGTPTALLTGHTFGPGGMADSTIIGAGGTGSNRLNTGYAPALTGSSWTIGMWLKDLPPQSALGTSPCYLFGDPGTNSFRCFWAGAGVGASDTAILLRNTGETDLRLPLPNGPAGTWYVHFVYNSADNTLKAYRNGVFVTQVSWTSPIMNGAGPLAIAGYSTSNFALWNNAKLDEFRLYNRALGETEIAETWNTTLPAVMTGLDPITSNIPDRFVLGQNYPNPFNPTTKIKFALPKAGLVSLKVYDMLGREVQTLVNQQLNAGEFIADFDGANLSSGTYFYRLQVGDFVEIKKMVLLK